MLWKMKIYLHQKSHSSKRCNNHSFKYKGLDTKASEINDNKDILNINIINQVNSNKSHSLIEDQNIQLKPKENKNEIIEKAKVESSQIIKVVEHNDSIIKTSPNKIQNTQRKPVLNAIRMMYNASGKTSNPSELLEITANESYTLPHKSNIQKTVKKHSKTRKIMIKDMINKTHKRQEIFNHMDRIIKGDNFYFMKKNCSVVANTFDQNQHESQFEDFNCNKQSKFNQISDQQNTRSKTSDI